MGDRVVDDPAALANLLRSPSQVLQLTPAERLLMGVPEERKQRINQLMAMLTNRPGPSVPARPSALDEASWANASSSAYFSAADGLDLPSAPKAGMLLQSFPTFSAHTQQQASDARQVKPEVMGDVGDANEDFFMANELDGINAVDQEERRRDSSSSAEPSDIYFASEGSSARPHDLSDQERLLRRRTQNRESAQRRRVRSRVVRTELFEQNEVLREHIKTLVGMIESLKSKLVAYDPGAAADVQLPRMPPRISY